MAKLNFNPQSADKREERGPMPAGEYLFSITESDVKPGARPGSQLLKLTYTCLSDGYKGRRMWQNLNLVHPNADAQRIAQSELREICEAVGLGNQVVDDSARLHGVPMWVRIRVEKDDTGRYDDANRPTGWKPANGVGTVPAAGGFKPPVTTAPVPNDLPPPPTTPDAARPAPPWMKRAG